MTWTYSGDPSANARDAIRFLIGDTDTTDQLLSDEEIAWVNTEASGTPTATTDLYDAAYRCCLTIAAKLARQADKQIGDLSVKLSNEPPPIARRPIRSNNSQCDRVECLFHTQVVSRSRTSRSTKTIQTSTASGSQLDSSRISVTEERRSKASMRGVLTGDVC